MGKGSSLEIAMREFSRELFEMMGYTVHRVRKQWSGTQYGFDVHVIFLDNNDLQREICIECKDYSKEVEWKELLVKIIQVNASPYDPSAFIGISPHKNISNVNDASLKELEKAIKFPIDIWCPDCKVQELFALSPKIYKTVYKIDCDYKIDKTRKIGETKNKIEYLLNKKTQMNLLKKIEIIDSTKEPNEDNSFKIMLDEKLDVLSPSDEDRNAYHKFRCDYKVYLQGLEDVDNELRNQIIKWQNDLRLKAKRLTKRFHDLGQTPTEFFHDFFNEAETSMGVFLSNNKLMANETERLLQGVVFELAAECPLNWVPKNA